MKGLFQGRDWLGNAQLPHPPIMDGILQVVENALREAWRQVCQTADLNGIKAADAYEDQLTEALWKRLNYIRLQEPPSIPGFTPDLFESVQREGNWRNCQNTSIDKQPDLVFKFHWRRHPNVPIASAAYDGLFVECKPVDKKHTIKDDYLKKGLSRFVDGTYAWAMQEAMMLGYVSNSASLNSTLVPILSKAPVQASLKMSGPPTPCKADDAIADRCETLHSRDCTHSHTGMKAGSIQVRHLWLDCSGDNT